MGVYPFLCIKGCADTLFCNTAYETIVYEFHSEILIGIRWYTVYLFQSRRYDIEANHFKEEDAAINMQ